MGEKAYARCELNRKVDIIALHTAFIKNMESGTGSPGEFHNFWELVLVIDGELMAATEKEVFLVKKNCMIVHPPMAFHRHFNSSDQDTIILVISFDAYAIPIMKNSIFVLDGQAVDECVAIVELICQNYKIINGMGVTEQKTSNEFVGQEIKSRLELFLVNAFSGTTLPRKNVNSDYKRIVKYVKEHLSQSLTLTDIANALNMSASNVKKIFSKYSGMGVMTYYNRCRVEQSVRLLENGFSVKDTAEMLGYSSQSAFCTAFKNILGFPPSKVKE